MAELSWANIATNVAGTGNVTTNYPDLTALTRTQRFHGCACTFKIQQLPGMVVAAQ